MSHIQNFTVNVKEINIHDIVCGGHANELFIHSDTAPTNNNDTERLKFLNGIIILLCKTDGGQLTLNGKTHRLHKNNIILLPENHIIEQVNEMRLSEHFYIAVSTDYILNMPSPIDTSIFGYSRYLSVIPVSDTKYDDLATYYKFIDKENREQSKYQNEIIRSIFYALILEIVAECEKVLDVNSSDSIKADNLSDSFFRLLATYYKKNRSVKFYAERLNITPKYLSAVVKRATGRPILEWIHEAVLIEAKMLLCTSELTVQQIADQLNFSSPSAFIQFIKKHLGTTPKRLGHSNGA